MNIDKKVLYSCSIFLTFALLGILFVPKDLIVIIAAALSAAAAVAISLIIRKRNILSINKDQVLLVMAVVGVLYVTVYYLTGIEFGFYRSSTLSLTTLFTKIIPIAITVIAIEIIRNVILAQGSKLASVMMFVIGVSSELLLAGGLAGQMDHSRFMDIMAMALMPAISANLLYHYLSRRYGVWPVAAYRLIISLYAYLIPVSSAIPDSIIAFANLLLPLAIYFFVDILYEKKKKRALEKNKGWWQYVAMGISLVLMTSIMMLVSCQFRFGVLIIATESMTGSINKGDAVVYEKYDGHIISEGDVIIFDKDGRTTVHRVVEIERIDGKTRYYTKGDANDSNDVGYITDENIEAVTKFKIAYLGYPSLWLRDVFK